MQRFGQGSPYLRIEGLLTTPEGKAAWNVLQSIPAGNAHLYLPGVGTEPVLGYQSGNYVDSAGTQPAVIDQPVGLVLDAAGSVCAELSGGLGSPENWTPVNNATISGGVVTLPNAGAMIASAGVIVQAGRTYRVDLNVLSASNAYINLYAGNGAYFGITTLGKKTVHLKALNDGLFTLQQDGGAVGACQVSDLSVSEVTGIHASQGTVGYKPIERRGIVNRISNSNRPSLWGAANGASVTGFNLSLPNEYALVAVGQPAPSVTSGPITLAFKLSGSGTCRILQDSGSGAVSLANVTLTDQPTIYVATFTASTGFSAIIGRWGGDTATAVVVEQGGIFQGALTAAQIIAAGGIPLTTTAPASSSAGNAYLEFDGVDDSLTLSGPLFQMADDHCVVAAFTPEKLQATFSAPSYSGNNRFAAINTTSGGQYLVEWYDGATYVPLAVECTLGVPVVITAWKVGGNLIARKNGVQFGIGTAFSAAVQATTGAIGTGPIGVGKGRIHANPVVKGTLTLADVQQLERFAAQRAGIQL